MKNKFSLFLFTSLISVTMHTFTMQSLNSAILPHYTPYTEPGHAPRTEPDKTKKVMNKKIEPLSLLTRIIKNKYFEKCLEQGTCKKIEIGDVTIEQKKSEKLKWLEFKVKGYEGEFDNPEENILDIEKKDKPLKYQILKIHREKHTNHGSKTYREDRITVFDDLTKCMRPVYDHNDRGWMTCKTFLTDQDQEKLNNLKTE